MPHLFMFVAFLALSFWPMSVSIVRSAPYSSTTEGSQPRCSLRAYVNDPDPNGLNVRQGPGTKYKVIGVIPNQHAGTIVHIDDAKDGWLHINEADVIELDEAAVAPVTDVGWVFGKLIRVDLPEALYIERANGDVYLYSKPDTKSEKLHKVRRTEPVSFLGITDCNGSWAKVEIGYPGDKRNYSGWLHPNDQCSSPVTTCLWEPLPTE